MLRNAIIALLTIGCVGQTSRGGEGLQSANPANVSIQSAERVEEPAPTCDPTRAAGVAPLASGVNAPALTFATGSGVVDTRAACGKALFAVALDESCTVCREFARFDASDLLSAWHDTAPDARLVVVVTRVTNGRGGFRTAQVSDIPRIRSQYQLSSDVEVAVDTNASFSQLGYLGPKLGLLLDRHNRVVSFAPTVESADVLATR